MARLPGAADVGVDMPEGSRVIANPDLSGLSRAAASITQGGQALGQGIEKLGSGVAAYGTDWADYQVAQAKADWLSNDADIKKGLQHDQEYTTLEDRYAKQTTERRDKSANLISEGPRRALFLQNTDAQIKTSAGVFKEKAFSLEGDAQSTYTLQQGQKMIDLATATDDPVERARLIQAHNDLIDGLVAKGYKRQSEGFAMKQSWAQQYALADGVVRAQTNPQGVINDLRAAPNSDDAITNRILYVEGKGKNPNSSASGVGQFIDSTWIDVLKRNRPDLAKGRSDAELLAFRSDDGLARDMTNVYRAENAAYLTKRGIEATPGNQYLAHFLGAGGAAAVLQADPNMPVLDVLTKAVGADKAKQMVNANASILDGKLAGSVKEWADGKMGGATAGGGQIYDFLPPAQRAQLLAHAQVALGKQTANDASVLKSRVEDTLSEAGRNGFAINPLGMGEFVRSLGPVDGADAYKKYNAQLTLSRDISQVATMTPAQQNDLLASYTAEPGSEGYADQAKRQDSVRKAIDTVRKARDEDPAQFAITRIPSVQDAYKTFATTVADVKADVPAKQMAARDFVNKTIMEQQKSGVAATDIRILPTGYVESLKARLDNPQAAGGTSNVVKQLQAEATLWGDNWPMIYRQIAKETGPLVRVIGSGVGELPSRILTELAPQKLNEILKDESEAKATEVKKDVLTAFKPFLASMAGNEGTISLFGDFRAQGEKLSAYYIVNGMSSSDAAERAFKDLIGDRYEFKDGWRAPKGLPDKVDTIAAGARHAMKDLAQLDIMPPVDRGEGLSEKYRLDRAAAAIRRDGKWVTAPDESGLALIYKDEAVLKRNGQPLIMRWSQLGAIGDRLQREFDAVGMAGQDGIGGGSMPTGPGPI